MTLDESEKRVLDLFGSIEEQEMVLSRFGLIKKLFELLSTNKKYIEAYEVGVSSGLLTNSIQLLSQNGLLKKLEREHGSRLNKVCEFLQAEHIATNPWPRTTRGGRIHEVLREAVRRGSLPIDSFVKMWEDDINPSLDIPTGHRSTVDVRKVGQMQVASYLDLLVCSRETPMRRSHLTYL